MRDQVPTFPVPNQRVALAPHTDYWMQGARYGEIVGRRADGRFLVRLDATGRTIRLADDDFKEVG